MKGALSLLISLKDSRSKKKGLQMMGREGMGGDGREVI